MSSQQHNHGVQIGENHGVVNNTFNYHQRSDPSGQDGLSKITSQKSFGLCLGQAPQIEADAFIGRQDELEQMESMLVSTDKTNQQRIISIVGMGGIGKTQLALAFARTHATSYSSVFWLDAQDESRVEQSLSHANAIVYPKEIPDSAIKQPNERSNANSMRRWLSEPWNDGWLLLFDNYDDPDLPGIRSPTGYDIRKHFPMTAQGTIIITTRSPKLAFSKQLKLQKLPDIETSLSILSQRAGQDLTTDDGGRALAKRLDGFPLALATAGTYIGQTTCSCAEYLQAYETAWSELYGEDTEELYDYENRSLGSTWDISVKQVRSASPDAAELLMFLAYFDNQRIDYDLFHRDRTGKLPWLGRVTKTKIAYERTMSKLRDYSLIEVSEQSYHLHPCLHDWLVCHANNPPDRSTFQAAVSCVTHAAWHSEFGITRIRDRGRMSTHFTHLASERFTDCWVESTDLAVLLAAQVFGFNAYIHAEYRYALPMYDLALSGYLKVIQSESPMAFAAMMHLATLYQDMWLLEIARTIWKDAAAALEKAFGVEHLVFRLCVRRVAVLDLVLDPSRSLRVTERFKDRVKDDDNHFANVLGWITQTIMFEHLNDRLAEVNMNRYEDYPWHHWEGFRFSIQNKICKSWDLVKTVAVDGLLEQAQSGSEDILAPNDILQSATLGNVVFNLNDLREHPACFEDQANKTSTDKRNEDNISWPNYLRD